MANKYSRYQLTPYVSQYVDPGSTTVATILRGRYDKNRQQYDMLDRAANSINTLDGDRHIKEGAIKDVNDSFARTIEVGNFENAGRVVSETANDFIGNRGLQLAQQSYQSRQAELKVIDTLRANGKQVLDFNEIRDTDENSPTFGQVIGHRTDAHSSYYQDPNSGQMVEDVYRPGSEMMLGYTKRMETLLAGIARSGGGTALKKSDIEGYVKYITSQGVSRTRAYKVVEEALDAYLDSPEGTQDFRKLTQIEGMSDDDAKLDMINRMQGVVEKQIHSISVPHYMQDRGSGGANANAGNSQTRNGTVLNGSDLTQYTDLMEKANDLKKEMGELSPNSQEYKDKRQELITNRADRNRRNRQSLALNPELEKSMKIGKDILGTQYAALEDLLWEATTDDDWHLGKSILQMGSDIAYAVTGGKKRLRTRFDNVSSVFGWESWEKKDLLAQFDDEDSIDRINKLAGTDYTKADQKEIHKIVGEWYDWMKGRGNYEHLDKGVFSKDVHGDAVYDHLDNTRDIKDTDAFAFSIEGSKELTATNKMLTQYDFSDFNFEFQSTKEAKKAKDAWDKAKRAYDSGQAQDIIQFEGITIPSLTTPSRMIVNINGTRQVVSPKDGQRRAELQQNIFEAMGQPMHAQIDYLAKAYQDGQLDNGGLIGYTMEHYDGLLTNGNITKDLHEKEMEKLILGINVSLAETFSLTLEDVQEMHNNDRPKWQEYYSDWALEKYEAY